MCDSRQTMWLSIILPTYNRATLVTRAIDSCLRESMLDFEIIVIDDGSTDNTANVLKSYKTDQLRVVRLERNVGVSEARTAGVGAANGEWLLFLDSDDELTPGALVVLRALCREAPADIGRLALMYVLDDGSTSPEPWMPGVIMDYRAYFEWFEQVSAHMEFSNCVRQSSFAVARFPRGRVYESIYHMDFAKAFSTLCCGDVIMQLHADCPDRLTKASTHHLRTRLLAEAEPSMHSIAEILDRHGEALRCYSPSWALKYSRAFITDALMAGHRRAALRGFLSHVGRYPRSYSVWAIMAIGLLSKHALSWIIAMKRGSWKRGM